MPYSWSGSATTAKVVGDVQASMDLALLSNDRFSGVNVTVRSVVMQNDATVAAVTQNNQVMAYRGVGGVTVGNNLATAPKASFDSAQSSSPLVRLYYPSTGDGVNAVGLAGTPLGAIAWRAGGSRQRTSIEQTLAFNEYMLPRIAELRNFILKPGEYLFLRVVPVTASANSQSQAWLASFVWQEETISTYTIGSNVTLNGVGVVGAKVVVLVADDAALTNATVWGVYTTGAGGSWTSSAIPVGKYSYAYAQHDAGGGTLYSATGAPYIS